MRTLFYPKFALLSIQKNQKIYLPYTLSATLWVCIFYILYALSYGELVDGLTGGRTLAMILGYANPIIFIFSVIFLLYTNSFLSRWRNKEYALYNVLGMNKANLAAVLFWETLITGGGAIATGAVCGIALYKLAELCLLKMIQGEASFTLGIDGAALGYTALSYGAIFGIILFKNIWNIQTKSALALLKSEQMGEQPPKANWLLGLLGVVMLCAGYGIALTVTDPMSAIALFFVAVVLVVLATELLFGAGSVLLCTLLQKNKGYYYKPHHFIALSSMRFRMKRNGAGLASICILSTMVLVMLSATVSLYVSCEETIAQRYPREQNAYLTITDVASLEAIDLQEIGDFFAEDVAQNGGTVENEFYYKMVASAGRVKDSSLKLTFSTDELSATADIYQVFFVSLDDYNRIMGASETLAETEILLYTPRGVYTHDTLTIEESDCTYTIKENLDAMWVNGAAVANIFPSMYLVVADVTAATSALTQNAADAQSAQRSILQCSVSYSFDTGLADDAQIAYSSLALDTENAVDVTAFRTQFATCDNFKLESAVNEQQGLYSLYGGLLFIGVVLSLLFASATVLIMYYKQMVEGYEDQKRFLILKKIGLTDREIQRSINSQLLTVFALPLGMAGLHLLFAFPILSLFLQMFNMGDTGLFIAATLGCYVIFGTLYALVYRVTSQLYYQIVNHAAT